MQNKPIYLWPFIVVYRIVIMILKLPLAIIHYFLMGFFFSIYTLIEIFVDMGIFISFVWWKFIKYLFLGISLPVVLIGRTLKHTKDTAINEEAIIPKHVKEPSKNKLPKPVKAIAAAAAATAGVLNAGPLPVKEMSKAEIEKVDKELEKLKKENEKEAAIHQKKMDELHKKEEIKAAKEKIKLDKITKKKEAEELARQKQDAENQIKEQQMLMREEKRKQEAAVAFEKKKLEESIVKEKKEKPKSLAQTKKEQAKAEKIRLKQEKIQHKKELLAERKKFKEKNTYVNDKVVIEKKNLGDYINSGLEQLIKVPKMFKEKVKNSFSNSAFVKNRRNVEDMHREALLIDFTGDDAKKSDKKIVYEYVGKNVEGKLVKAYFEAFSKVEVHSFLLSEGFEVYSIKTSPLIQFLHGAKQSRTVRFKNKDLIFFLTQLSTYIKAGIPLVESLRILSRQFPQKGYQKVFRAMIYDLTMGDNFSVALEKQGNAYPKLLVNMVKTSEMTGELPETLDDMQIYFAEAEKTKKQMITALTYPTIVFVLAIAAITFIMIYIVPQFAGIYADMDNAKLPGITVAIMNVSDFLKNYWIYLIAVVFGVIFIFGYLYRNVKLFRTLIQWFLMKLPVIGDVMIYNEVTMFTKTFASLLKHNVFITDTMEILNKITNNEIWKMIILDTITNLAKGEKISLAFQDHWAVPIPAYEMIVTGERTGQLPEMMQKVSDYYQELHKNAVGRIKAFIEPILILFLTGAVGVIVLSIVIPMFDMYSQLS